MEEAERLSACDEVGVLVSREVVGYVKIRLEANGVREGVEMRTGVWRESDSGFILPEEVEDGGGMVIFGFGFSGLVEIWHFVEGPGSSESTGSILIPPRVGRTGLESESESESWTLQMGRWASRTSSSFSFFFCSSAISFCRQDFLSSNWSVSCNKGGTIWSKSVKKVSSTSSLTYGSL